ncbi:hypothetical protein SAMD00023353_0204300 [Rosellinia necatrix]|uniref:Uncharacterized protein n=1 Tax=Rosellinia necatrix TaxID=77044 RepID=A0A1S8A530_ROSNE|nr:hypothetical protein SAMD00023353_0204300 [Rosellinia necatrix]
MERDPRAANRVANNRIAKRTSRNARPYAVDGRSGGQGPVYSPYTLSRLRPRPRPSTGVRGNIQGPASSPSAFSRPRSFTNARDDGQVPVHNAGTFSRPRPSLIESTSGRAMVGASRWTDQENLEEGGQARDYL